MEEQQKLIQPHNDSQAQQFYTSVWINIYGYCNSNIQEIHKSLITIVCWVIQRYDNNNIQVAKIYKTTIIIYLTYNLQ